MAEDQPKIKRNPAEHLKTWQFKKGQSGNPAGRPPGKSLKEYTREMLAAMDDDERQAFLSGLPKEQVWKMAEGNPENQTDKFAGDTFVFPSGARIRTGHLADKEAYQKYQGHEYHKILIEELTHIAREGDYETWQPNHLTKVCVLT